jgi:hypothetical protein
MHATWSNVNTTRESCFYFSGPRGRDNQLVGDAVLERDGDKVTMRWGNATFTGTYRDTVLDLQRKSTHSFGDQWTTTEKIHAEYHAQDEGGKLVGTYVYEECEQHQRCPGDCRIEADLDLGAT